MEMAEAGTPIGQGCMMARVTHVHTIDEVATRIGENLELIEIVSANSDNIDYCEMIRVDDGTEEGIKTFTDRGIECLQELLADIRTWDGGLLEFLNDEQCDPNIIELDLSRFRAAPGARLSHFPFEGDRAFPAQC